MKEFSLVKGAVARATGNIEKAIIQVNIHDKDSNKNPLADIKYHTYIVKYNPSSIRVSAQAGSFQSSGVGANGLNQITQINVAGRVQFDVDLILEDLNNMDAFMQDKLLLDAGVGQGISSGISGLKKSKQGGYSVQDQTEAFVGLLMSEKYRRAKFLWANMCFEGEITSVGAQYTMFNPVGHPIRSVIHLSMQQNDCDKKDPYWNDALNALFNEASTYEQLMNNNGLGDKTVDSRNWQSYAGNLFNL